MTPPPLPADLQALHEQILDCEAQGYTGLAAALRPMLARQMHERGIQPAALDERPPMSGTARDLFNLFAPRQP